MWRSSGGYGFAGSGAPGCLGKALSLARFVDRRCWIVVEVLLDSGWRIVEPGLKLDHSHYSLFAAVGKTVAAREGSAFGIESGIVPGIGFADMGIVVGCIEADMLQWGNSPLAGWHSCSVFVHHHIRCWPEWAGKQTEGRLRGWWGKHAHLWVCSCAHCCN